MTQIPPHLSTTTIAWPQLNQDSELLPAHLIYSFGPALYRTVQPVWPYALRGPDSIVPVNHVLDFQTFGHRVGLQAELERRVRVEVVADHSPAGMLQRAHLACRCSLHRSEAEHAQDALATGTFWMALTRPLASPARRRIEQLPAELAQIETRASTPQDLIAESINAYHLPWNGEEGALASGHETIVFHYDRSDLYQHVNTVVYMQMGLDQLALTAYRHGMNPAALRFRRLTVYFRKPFMPGDPARVETELHRSGTRFVAAVRYRHLDQLGRPSAKLSTAMRVAGVLRT